MKKNIVYSVLNYAELKERISLGFLDKIIICLSPKAKSNSSAIIAIFDSLIEENRRITKQIDIWQGNLEQIRNYTLDQLLCDNQPDNAKEPKYKYTLDRYMKKIELYTEINRRQRDLLKSTQELYTKCNTVRLFSSLYDCVNSGKNGVMMYCSDFDLDDAKRKKLEEDALKSDEDIILFTEYGIDEDQVTFFGSNYKGIIIKKSCSFEKAFDFINETFAVKEIIDTVVRIF